MADCVIEGYEICPVYTTLDAIGGRWKPLIVWYLFQGARRYSELQRQIDGVTPKMLTQQLRELERAGLVNRKVYPEVPPRVEYTLTPMGSSLRAVLDSMAQWGRAQEKKLAGKSGQPKLAHAQSR